MPPRRPGTLASGRRKKSSTSSLGVVARIQEQQKRLEQEQHQRSLAAALTAREVDADDDSDYGIELDDSVSGQEERSLPPESPAKLHRSVLFFELLSFFARSPELLFASVFNVHKRHDRAKTD